MVSFRDRFSFRITAPPAQYDPEYFRILGDALNALPPFSVFSAATPESTVTATAGTLGINKGTNVASGVSALWAKQLGSGNTGWVALA